MATPLLGVNQPIESWPDIKAVVPLANARPVYLLVGTDDSHVVIKNEVGGQSDATNLKFANRAMRTVSPAFVSKVCLRSEVQVLKQRVDYEVMLCDMKLLPLPAEIDHLDQSLQNGGVWFKMEKAEGVLGLNTAMAQARNQQDKSGIRQIAAALQKGGLDALGKIIAADLFNGNTDRFNPFNQDRFGNTVRAGDVIPGSNPLQRFAVLLNVGNVLISMQNNQNRPIGLDAYEAQGDWRKLDKTIQQLELVAQNNERWPGRHLEDTPQEAQWRAQFAALVAADLETALGPRNRKIFWGTRRRLPKNAAARILAGMNAGIRELQTTFAQYVNKPGKARPVGLTDRLNILGW